MGNLQNYLKLKSKKTSISKDITELMGEGVKIKESPKSKKEREKKFFINLVEALIELDNRTLTLLDFGLDFINYENPYHTLLENFIIIHYGPAAGEIVLWWIKEKNDREEKVLSIKVNEDTETIVNTPSQLYRAIMKINKMIDA